MSEATRNPSIQMVLNLQHSRPAWLFQITLTLYMLCRGYTRKEPFANGIWTPKAENWNGRTAMMGFTGIVITEALAGKSVLEVNHFLGSCALFVCVMTPFLCWGMLVCVVSVPHLTTCCVPAV